MARFTGNGEDAKTGGFSAYVLEGGVVAEVGNGNQQAVSEEKIDADVAIEPDGGIRGEMLDSASGTIACEIGQYLREESVAKADLGISQGQPVHTVNQLHVAEHVATSAIDGYGSPRVGNAQVLQGQIGYGGHCIEIEGRVRIVCVAR